MNIYILKKMGKNISIWKCLFILLLVVVSATRNKINASTVTDLYSATIPLQNNQLPTSKDLLRAGLTQVLIKVSGNLNVIKQSIIQSALNDPEFYLLKYTQNSSDQDATTIKHVVLKQTFISSRVDELLKRAGVAIWGKQRPVTLVWVMIESEPQNQVILNATTSDLNKLSQETKRIVDNNTAARGIPILYPLQDLDEELSINKSAIWMQFSGDIQKYSSQYNADLIMAVSLQAAEGNLWHGKWLLIDNSQKLLQFTTTGTQLADNIEQGINWLADNLALRYTTNIAALSKEVNLKINGVFSLDDYNKLNKYLSNLSAIDDMELKQVGSGWLDLSVRVKDGQIGLLQALSLDSKLLQVNNNSELLQFRWRS